MLEGLVRQLLLGYLGRYVKDIQKEQLKITLWNGNVFFLLILFLHLRPYRSTYTTLAVYGFWCS
jgi:hypothetical protein